MQFLKSLVLGAMLIASSAYAEGFGFSVGPFDLQFGGGTSGFSDGGHIVMRNVILDDPICEAISSQQQLGFTVEGRESVSPKEVKIVTKRLVVEPYAFGVTQGGRPVLRGKVVSETLIKEVTVRYGDDQVSEAEKSKVLSGWLQTSDKTNIDIRHISDVQVIPNTHFNAPKNYKGLRDDNIKVICHLPVKVNK